MAIEHIVRVYAFILILVCSVLQAFTPSGYEGCFGSKMWEWSWADLNLETIDENTGEKCKMRCIGMNLRYAGTWKHRCACFDNLSRYENSSGCHAACPGNPAEICGGQYRMSVYDTLGSVVTTVSTTENIVTQDPPTSTQSSASNEASDTWTTESTKDQGEGSLIAVYITVPSVLVILVIISITTFFIWRRRQNKDTTDSTGMSSAMVNRAYNEVLVANSVPPRYSELDLPNDQYSEINLDTEGVEERGNNEYNTIDMKQPKCQEETNEYNHLTGKPDKFTDTSYAHIDPSTCVKINKGPPVSPYSNTLTTQTTVNGIVSESDYNRLQTWTAEVKDDARDRDKSEEDPAYDHAAGGGESSGQDIQPDNYSHLN